MRGIVVCLALMSVISVATQARAEDLIHVEVVGLHNDVGQVGCTIFSSPDGFPTDPSKALRKMMTPIENEKAICDFTGFKPGRYAVAVMHDENSNGKLDTNFLGIPKEGTGASNDAKGAMGPPKFDDATFDYAGGRKDLTVHIGY